MKLLVTLLLLIALGAAARPAAGGPAQWPTDLVSRLEHEIARQGDVGWVNDVVVSDLSGCDPSERERLLAEVPLDLLDWYCGAGMNAGNFFRWRGIRTSACEEYEYEESLQFRTRDTERLFRNNGMGLSLDGKPLPMGGEYTGAYYMNLNAPKWREVVRQGLLRPAAFGDTITQDNIGVGIPISWGFDRWDMRFFRDWLRERYSPARLGAMGARDLPNLDMRRHISDRRAAGGIDAVWDDALAREFVKFQYVSNLATWGRMVRDTKAEAVRLGRPCPALYGNQCRDVVGLSPFQVAQSRLVDVVWLEIGMFQPFRPSASATASLVYKVGLASGGFRKPVWNIEYPGSFGNPGGVTARVVLAEASAQGGLVYVRDPDYLRFLDRHRSLFARRQPMARTALVYSIPSLMWRTFGPLQRSWAGREHFCGLARILEDRHVPYDVLIFGHPELWDDAESFRRLDRYDTLVLPSVDCMTDAQIAAVRRFVARGGKVVACGPLAERDEGYRRRPAPALAKDTAGPRWTTLTPAQMSTYLSRKPASPGAPEVAAVEESVAKAAGAGAPVAAEAPATLWIQPWAQSGGRRIAVHLVNYDVDLNADALRPAERVTLHVRLPRGFRAERAVHVPLGRPDQPLDVAVRNGVATVVVPRVETYSIVVLTQGEELAAADRIAQVRRTLDRLRVASGHPVPGALSARLAQAEARHLRGEDAAASREAASLGSDAGKALQRQIIANLDGERRGREQALAAASRAVKAFDFGDGPVAEDWTGVTSHTAYDAKSGFGWLECGGIRVLAGGPPDPLHGDLLGATGERTFRVDLPPGSYRVSVLSGGPYQYVAATSVMANGDWRLLGERGHAGLARCRTFTAGPVGGHLDLTFSGTLQCDDQGNAYRGSPDWFVCGILIRRADSTGSPFDQVARGALRDWLISESVADESCLGMETAYPVERALLAGPGQGRQVLPAWRQSPARGGGGWRLYTPASRKGFAPVPLDALVGTEGERVTYALTHVYSPSARKARLWAGTTGLGVVWLNGREVVRDLAAAGLQADEHRVPIDLRRGWNSILVKVCHFWGHRSGFSLCLTDPAGKPMADVTTSPTCGETHRLARICPFPTPELALSAETLDWGGQVTASVRLVNAGREALSGQVDLVPEEGSQQGITVSPAESPSFTGLGAGRALSRQFALALSGAAPGMDRVDLRARVTSGGRTATSRAVSLRLRRPTVTLTAPARALREPAERVVDDFTAAGEWQPHQKDVQVSADTERVKEGSRSLRIVCTTPGDGKPDNRTAFRSFTGSDWSAYNTLAYWVYIEEGDPGVKARQFCVVVYNRDGRGGQQFAMHTGVPVGRWVRFEEDISGYSRDDVSSIVPHLYMADAAKKERYTFWFSPFRLLRAPAAGSQAVSLDTKAAAGTLRVQISNPLPSPLDGTLSLLPPAGWRVEPQGQPFTAAPGKQWSGTFQVAPPPEGVGTKAPATARLSSAAGTLDVPVEIDLPRVALCPTAPAPTLDGVLDDACWRGAPLAGFALVDGSGAAGQQTEAWVCRDDRRLYVAMRCHEREMAQLRATVAAPDGPVWEDDSVEVFLQPPGLSGYHHLLANALGTVRQELAGGRTAAVECKAARAADAWVLEMAIPLADLGVSPQPQQAWGFNLNRGRPARGAAPAEYSGWSCTYGSFHVPSRFGMLLFE